MSLSVEHDIVQLFDILADIHSFSSYDLLFHDCMTVEVVLNLIYRRMSVVVSC